MTRSFLNSLDLTKFNNHLHDYVKGQFHEGAGSEHYRLLTEISKEKNIIYDIGTYRGASAVALSNANHVHTWDVQNLLVCDLPENVTYHIGDCLTPDLIAADLILLDTFHDGGFEKKAYNYLCENGYKGVLILDDIHLNQEMDEFWSEIFHEKEDVTEIGHYTGTGIVYFSGKKSIFA